MSEQTIDGNNRSNIIISGASDDTINAGGGNDLVISGAGDDTINGGRGSDIIISGSGDDVINGGSGSDILISGSGDDTVNGGSGNDIIISGSGDDTVSGGSGNDLILTGSGDDIVSGGAGHDVIDTGTGDDVVDGGSGHDVIMTGDGNDTATGAAGNDTLITGSGNDTILGNEGHDVIVSGSGDDTIDGGAGHDIILSGEGHDTIDGGSGHDVILSGNGNDTVDGASGDDVIITGYGSDTIDGGDGYDWIHAGADDDVINSGAGFDYVNGGTGYDIAIFSGNSNDYSIVEVDTNEFEVTHISSGEVDSVINVELFRFNDKDVDPANPSTNSDPVASDDTVSTNEDTAVTIDVLSNDSDVDGDALVVTTAAAVNGSVSINTDGTLVYMPDANFNGSDTISYEISDGQGGTSTATVNVTVNAVNDGPVATTDSVTLDEDTSAMIDVLANDTDLDGDTLSVSSASASNGSVTINVDGTLAYTPDANFNGSDTISYEISDGQGGTSTATVNVTVNAVNDGPVATNDSVSVDEDSSVSINVLANDSDIDGDTLSVSSASASNGSVSINTDGTLAYTPNANFNGNDTISYEINDGQGGSATATVDVTVNATNIDPTAVNDNFTAFEDQSITINVLANDSDADGDSLSITSATAQNGAVTINPNGTISYTPNTNFNGTDSITYEISDGQGGINTAIANITINAVNDAPIATDDTAFTNVDSSITIDVLLNDSDADGNTLNINAATALNGTVTINADGTLLYVPVDNFEGYDSITYEVSDGNGGSNTATVSILVNSKPVAEDDVVIINEDTSVVINVLSNDSDFDGDALSVTQASAPNGSVTINVDGTLSYTPNINFNGNDSITYEISDGNGGISLGTVNVTVNAVNDGPVAVDDSVTVEVNTTTTVNVLNNDSDLDGDALSVTSAVATNGTVTINLDGTLSYSPNADFTGIDSITYELSDGAGGLSSATVSIEVNTSPVAVADTITTNEDTTFTVNVLSNDSDLDGDVLTVSSASAENGSVTINIDGTLSYTPKANFNGPDTISYEITDGKGGVSSTIVNVTVNALNDDPVAENDTVSTDINTGVTINVLSNDSDVDSDILSVTNATATNGSITINLDGTLSYTPNIDFNGIDSVTYDISDGNGGSSSATVSVMVNTLPVAADDAIVTNEDTAVDINVLSNDSDPDGNILSVTTATAFNGMVAINSDGTLSYTPNSDFNGSDVITYEIGDGKGGQSSATVNVTVNAVEDEPVAADDSIITSENTAVVLDVLSNDIDPDGDALIITTASAANGSVTINVDGTLSYIPNDNFNGVDTINYEISDGNGGSSEASVSVTVGAVNDDPIAINDVINTDEDATVTINVLANDSDIDGDVLSVSNAIATNGAVIINVDGTLSYTPNANFNGNDTISYEVTDGLGGQSSASVSITVNAVNDAPVATDDEINTDVNTVVTIDVLSNDNDLDEDTLSVTAATADNGTVLINLDGTLSYTPNTDFNGADSISYEISDGFGGLSSAKVDVLVNTTPVAIDDTATTNEDTPVVINVLSNDTDPDGNSLSLTSATAANGLVSMNLNDGSLTYTPDANFYGSDTILYSISDAHGGSSTATVSVTVNAVNFSPSAIDDAIILNENTTVNLDVLSNDTDPDNDGLSVISATTLNGTVSINPDNTLSYTPNQNFNGADSINYEISDGRGGISSATAYVSVNSAPVTGDDSYTVNAGSNSEIASLIEFGSWVIDGRLLVNDSDPEGSALTISEVNGQALINGSVTVNGNNGGTFTVSSDGTANFDASIDFAAVAGGETAQTEVTYTVTDGQGGFDTATVTVTVNGFDNDAVQAQVDQLSVGDDSGVIALDVLANDLVLIDGDVPSISAVNGDTANVGSAITGSNGGLFTVNTDGSATFDTNGAFAQLREGQTETTSVSYSVTGFNGETSTTTVSVEVVGSNNAPVAQDDIYTVNAGSNGGIANLFELGSWVVDQRLLVNDIDPEGSPLTISEVNDQALINGSVTVVGNNGGTFTVSSDGTASFDASSDFAALAGGETAQTEVTYTVTDGQGGFDTATVSVTVNGFDNDAVQAQADQLSVGDDSGVIALDVLANDLVMIDGDVPSISAVNGDTANVGAAITGSNGGLFIINTDGSATFDTNGAFAQLSEGQTETTSVSYSITGFNGETSTTTVSIEVVGSNNAPIAQDDIYTVNAGSNGGIANLFELGSWVVDQRLLVNDIDPEGSALTISEVNGQALINGSVTVIGNNGGTFTVSSDGSASFDASTDFAAVPAGETTQTEITYTVTDGQGGFDTATVSVTVNGYNDAPEANPDAVIIQEEASVVIDVLSNDTDINGNTLSLVTASADNGFVTINADNTLTYTPNTDFYGTDSINYEITDGVASATGIVSVTVSPENDDPVAVSDLVHVDGSTTSILDVLANDIDVDGDVLSITSASADNGAVVINADGTISYTPNESAVGLDSISYAVTDGNGGISNATVTINRLPVTNNEIVNIEQDTAVTIDVLANDSDPDGASLSVSNASAMNGSVVINSDGSIDYTPNVGYLGNDIVSYGVDDGFGGLVTATVTVIINEEGVLNQQPDAMDDVFTVNAGSNSEIASLIEFGSWVIDGRLVVNDSDPEGSALTISEVNGQALINGSVTVNGSNGGTFIVKSDGTASFDASSDFAAVAGGETAQTEVTYTVTDGQGGFDTATVSVTVNGFDNDAVQAQADQLSVGDDSGVIDLNVIANDLILIEGDVPSISAVEGDGASVGTAVTGSNGGLFTINADGSATFDTNGAFAQLSEGQTETTSVSYSITGFNGETSTTTVSIEVVGSNNAPIAQDDIYTVNAGSNGGIANLFELGSWVVDQRLLVNDIDPEGSALTISEVNGQALINGSVTVMGNNGGTFTISSDGTASFDASSDFATVPAGETAQTEITYTVTDGQGGFDTATVSVTVNGLNDKPIASDDSATTGESTAITIDVLSNDSDIDGQSLSISSIDSTALLGTVIDNGDGTITYDPSAQFDALNDGETADEWFEYTVADGDGGFDTAQVQLTILGSTAPSASSSVSADSGSPEVVIEEAPVDNDFM